MLQRPVGAPDVVVEDLDAEICLYRRIDDQVLILNQSAADVWRLADGLLSVPEITERLASFYNVPVKALQHDVEVVAADLGRRGFLVDAGAAEESS